MPGCPSYLSTKPLPRPTRFNRESKEEQFAQGLRLSLEQQAHDDGRFTVHSLQDLITKLSLLPSSNQWVTWYSECTLHIFKPKIHDKVLNIEKRLVITENLAVMGFRNSGKIPLSIDNLSDTREVEVCFEEIESSTPNTLLDSFHDHLKEASKHLSLVITELHSKPSDLFTDNDSTLAYLSHLQFIQCQLDNSLVHKNSRRYNVITQVMALKSHLISPACYKYLQSLDCLTLPHPKTLQQFKFVLESDYSTFLKKGTSEFNKKERNLILHIDEIHVKSTVSYTGGRIIGYSLQPDQPIKTIFAMMASSLYKN